MNNFVVYEHYTKDTNRLFYIGEGRPDRPYSKRYRNRYWHFIVNKHDYYVIVTHENLTKEESERIETETIQKYKDQGFDLANFCIGPMYKNSWLANAPKELHPRFGKKSPQQSKRITEWNKQHSGVNSPVYGLRRADLSERNSFGLAVYCPQLDKEFKSIKAFMRETKLSRDSCNKMIKTGTPVKGYQLVKILK